MMYKTPLRLTILHFAQRFLIDAVTFITISPCDPASPEVQRQSRICDYTRTLYIRPGCYNSVKISGPFSVMATVCSKWAVSEPSADDTVH